MVAEMWLYEVGVVLVVVGAVASGYGFNLIKRSSLQEADLPFYKRRLLLAGLLLSSVVSSVLDVVSYAIVPLAVIAPLSGVSILSATFFASIGLGGAKERITPLKTLGVALVVSGIVIVAIVGPRPADDLEDLNEAFEGYTSTPFLVYQIVACAALAAIFTSLAAGILPLYSISRVVLCALSAGLASGLCQALIKLLATCFFEAVMHEAQPWQNPLFAIAIVQLVITGLLLFALVGGIQGTAALVSTRLTPPSYWWVAHQPLVVAFELALVALIGHRAWVPPFNWSFSAHTSDRGLAELLRAAHTSSGSYQDVCQALNALSSRAASSLLMARISARFRSRSSAVSRARCMTRA